MSELPVIHSESRDASESNFPERDFWTVRSGGMVLIPTMTIRAEETAAIATIRFLVIDILNSIDAVKEMVWELCEIPPWKR
jgi:hypothetical protein